MPRPRLLRPENHSIQVHRRGGDERWTEQIHDQRAPSPHQHVCWNHKLTQRRHLKQNHAVFQSRER